MKNIRNFGINFPKQPIFWQVAQVRWNWRSIQNKSVYTVQHFSILSRGATRIKLVEIQFSSMFRRILNPSKTIHTDAELLLNHRSMSRHEIHRSSMSASRVTISKKVHVKIVIYHGEWIFWKQPYFRCLCPSTWDINICKERVKSRSFHL